MASDQPTNGDQFPLNTIARFDGVALAQELREGIELLLAAKPNDTAFIRRVQVAFKKASAQLEGIEGGAEIIEALRPSVCREVN